MATAIDLGSSQISDEAVMHVYSLCFFKRDDIVPSVELIEAFDDTDAIHIALGKRPSLVREIWERHRFVARLTSRS